MCGLGDLGDIEDADAGEQRLKIMRVPDLTLGAGHPGVPVGIGHAGGQVGPRSAEDVAQAGQLRPSRHRQPWLPATGISEWEKVFANPMVTVAAMDRLVHHSVILEFDLPSYRTSEAEERQLQAKITSNPERPEQLSLTRSRISYLHPSSVARHDLTVL